jgi:hypothetical protein
VARIIWTPPGLRDLARVRDFLAPKTVPLPAVLCASSARK